MGKRKRESVAAAAKGKKLNGKGLAASSKVVDPTLAALFDSTLQTAPLSRAVSALPKASKNHALTDQEPVPENELDSATSAGAEEDEDLRGPVMVRYRVEFENFKEQSGRDGLESTQNRKRKRKDNAVDIEGAYMQRLAREEDKEAAIAEQARVEKRQKTALETDDIESLSSEERQDAQSGSDGDHDSESEALSDSPIPQHETLAPSNDITELEKAARTVFLGNVSTSTIKSKTSRTKLLDHLSSFIPSLSEHKPPHKVDSLRFRSTAYASSSVPKKAAFAKKELMDATTQSTNAYAVYSTPLAAREAARRLNGTVILERHLRVDSVAHPAQIDHRRCVFVGNLGFVDDESMIKAAEEGPDARRSRKAKEPGDAEEGLWRQFGKAGTVESVRVIRDKTTRVGKGIAYVQFNDQNAVEKALLFHEKKFPPLLPRILRVVRAKNIVKTASYSSKDEKPRPFKRPPREGVYIAKPSSQSQSLAGRAGKLLGRAGAAQMRHQEPRGNGTDKRINGIAKTPESIIFEGYRANGNVGKSTLKLKGRRKKMGKPKTRSSKRGTAFKAGGGKKKRETYT